MSVSRKREDVQARHELIQRLRRRPRFTLQAIAAAVGLTDHSSVWWHLKGDCRCLADRTFPLAEDEGCLHDWKCTKCRANG